MQDKVVKKENKLEKQTLEFATKIILLVKQLQNNRENIISNQIGRSATSIGANVREAAYASSKADFISKLQIALKESNESAYWLELLNKTDYISQSDYEELYKANQDIHFMLVSSINTAKKNNS